MDKKLTVLDATTIQYTIAELIIFPQDDLTSYLGRGDLNYLSDIDRDGERTVKDATVIQRKLAKLQ